MADLPAPGPAGAVDADLARIDALVGAERVRTLHQRLGVSQATVVVNSAVVAVVFWGRGDDVCIDMAGPRSGGARPWSATTRSSPR